ncbi:hypothetical protein ACN28G_19695 [Micromonospora sp. WMMA1923]|uniref:hypothetical protein n=1 Tax=Micromonospora sp. WMMA1923 TaxID=3404125 RepID=UPI003B95B1CA
MSATTASVTADVATPRPIAGWCPPGGCAARRAADLQDAAALAFELGRAHERAELAALELTTWRSRARLTHEQKVAERIASLPGTRPAPPLRFDDPDWPAVAVPGGGGLRLGHAQVVDARPDYLQHIGEPHPCGCVRRLGGGHRTPDSPIGEPA